MNGAEPDPDCTLAYLIKDLLEASCCMRSQRCFMALCICGVLSVARAAMELSAFASMGGDFRLLIINAESRASSGWLSLGDDFEGHRISRFNVADEVLTLERGAEVIPLRLKQDPVDQSGTRRRRVLDDGGAAEGRTRQVPIWIDNHGNVALGAAAVTFDEIEGLFRRLVAANANVEVIFVHVPLAPKENPERMRNTKQRCLAALRRRV